MKRRLFALLMAVVMIVTAIPAEVFAAGYGNVYGTNLGWEYAVISTNNDGGYSLKNPQTNSRVGTYYGDHVNVEFIDGTTKTAITEGSSGVKRNVLSKTSTVDVHVTCNYGYYISAIVLACAHQSDPFKCQTVATDDAYALAKPGSTLTNVTIRMSDIYEWAHHQSSVSTYYLMVELEPIPANVYVGYDAGTAGTTKITAVPVAETGTLSDGATQVSSYPTWNYTTTDLTAAPVHDALGISAAAEAAANALGYSFAGWHLEYYTAYTSSSNTFSGTMSVGGTNLAKGADVNLTLHAKLTAIWQPMIEISVTKVWDDANNQDGIRPESIEVHLLKNDAHLGSPVTLSAANNWTASWKVPQKDENGNTITYRVEETVPTGYTTAVTGTAEDGFTLTNTHVVERTNVQVQKVWTDDNNRDGLRPYGVVVQLYKNGEAVTSYIDSNGNSVSGTATLTADTSWTQQWLDLEKNKANGAGTANAYTVQEIGYVDANGQSVTNPGYTVSYDSDETGRLVVENIHQVATMDIPVQKVWNDANNQDGIRPASVTVALYADGTSTGKTLTLNAAGNWKGTFEDVYVNSAGTPINYSIVESASAGYTTAVTGTAAAGFTVTNTHTPETISVPVSKVWDDNENQDGIRPASITVALYADGVATGDTLVLNAANNWAGAFAGKAKYKAGAVGTAVVYTAQETGYTNSTGTHTGVPTGYTPTVNGTTITNTHTPETANLTVKKVWNDGENQDGNRPLSVTVTLNANGQPVLDGNNQPMTVTLNADNNWTAVWENMPRYHGGQRISYTVVESVPAGYTPTYSYDYTNAVATVTNTYTPQTTAINVQKTWADDDNRDGLRPDSVTVTLYQQIGTGTKTAVKSETLNPSNEWDVDFTDLPIYSGGQKITYTVEETPVPGYTSAYSTVDADTHVITITNTHTVERVDINATKVWNDANNQDGKRPYSVVLTLYANGEPAKDGQGNLLPSVTVTRDGSQTASWTGLHKKYHGTEIVYTVAETAYYETAGANLTEGIPTDYTSAIGTAANGYKVTNTYIPETISVPVTKVWNDANDQDGKRPDEITVALYQQIGSGAATPVLNASNIPITTVLSADNNWTASFDNLPKYATKQAGQEATASVEIIYTVVEQGESNGAITFNAGTTSEITYSVSYDQSTHTITNTYVPEKTSVTVIKQWNDNSNNDGKRPTSITVYLYENGKLSKTQVISTPDASNNTAETWSYTWTDLPMYKEGLKINYTVYEAATTDLDGKEYYVEYSRNSNDIVIKNSRDDLQTTFTAQKVWDDANNQDNIRPYAVVVQLYSTVNNTTTAYGAPVVLTAADHWRATWTLLPKLSSAETIVYSAKEIGYYATQEKHTANEQQSGMPTGYTHDPDTDYVVSNGVATITNKHTPKTIDLTVTKDWDDASNQDGKRPYGIELTLYRNGVAYRTERVTDSGDTWNYTFTDLPANHGIGIPNVYTVAETGYFMDDNSYGNASATPGVPTGYTATITGDAATGYTVTNKHTPEVVSVTVHKEWKDHGDQDGKRPSEIIVGLYYKDSQGHLTQVNNNGNSVYIALNASNNWTNSFDGLAKYDRGVAIDYVIKEMGESNGSITFNGGTDNTITYTVSYDEATNTITNSYTPETAKLNVQKVWDDANNQDGKRPFAVVVTLYQNGKPTTNTLTLKASDNWAGYWENMPRYHNGQRISYTVVETGYYKTEADFNGGQLTHGIPEGYTATHHYGTNNTTGEPLATVTNAYTPELTSLNVQKVWNDDDNRDGIRPQSLTITLYRKIGENGTWAPVLDSNNEKVTAVMNPANEWDVSFTDLPKYSNGQEIIYNAVEETVPTGYTIDNDSYVYDPATRMVTITNTHTVFTVDVTATKAWDDNNNQDGIRPQTVVLRLYANGIPTSATITLDGAADTSSEKYRETDEWEATWKGLLKNYHGVEIVYTVVEETVPAGYTVSVSKNSLNNYTVTNSHIPAVVSIPVAKTWADNNNQDGIRPETITVTLYADGIATNKTLTLKASENWIGSFGDLPAYANGKLIDYTVKEATIPGYTPTYSADDSTDGVLALSVTNTHAVEKTQLTVTKVWNDNNDQDGKRPDSIVVHLLANGVHTEKKVTVTADMDWTYTWTGLDKFAAGQEIIYTVYEEPVYFKGISPSGNARAIETYFASYVRNPEDPTEVIITNAYTPETTVITAMKVWDDGDNRDNLRTDKVTVELYADGTATGKTLTLNEKNDWVASWENLPKYKDHGKEIVYSVVENDVPEGYSVTIAQETEYAPGLFILSNVHSPALTNITVVKAWNDHDDNDGLRPETVTVSLLCNDEVLYTAELSESSDWTHSWNGLYKYVAGKEAKYTVVETAVEGYTASYAVVSDTNGHSIWTITNTHEKQTEELVVTTVWVDDNNSQKTRPEEVPAQLYKDGEPYGDIFKIVVTEDWQKTIVVPVFEDGEEIIWTVEQVQTPNPYTVTYNQGKLTIINTALFDDSPATGDSSNPVLLICLMAASCAGIAAILVLGRKKKRNEA